jgi:acetyl esterase/lipase
MEPLRKSTHTYAHHDVPLLCDVYDAADYPDESPVFLFFHAGGLVVGGRVFIPPWLVQVGNPI